MASVRNPVLRGDGVHDDASALEAWARGEIVAWPDGSRVGLKIENKTFRLSRPVWVRRSQAHVPTMFMDGCSFVLEFAHPENDDWPSVLM